MYDINLKVSGRISVVGALIVALSGCSLTQPISGCRGDCGQLVADAGDGSVAVASFTADAATPQPSTSASHRLDAAPERDGATASPGDASTDATSEHASTVADAHASEDSAVPCEGACPAELCGTDGTCLACVARSAVDSDPFALGCSPQAPHCFTGTATHPAVTQCVECTQDSECAQGICEPAEHRCVACVPGDGNTEIDPGCSIAERRCWLGTDAAEAAVQPADASATDASAQEIAAECVECLADSDCDGAARCHSQSHSCVSCLTHTDCTDPTAAQCDTTDGSCIPCGEILTTLNGDAGPIPNIGEGADSGSVSSQAVCSQFTDLNVCHTGECVQCFGAESSACGEFLCDDVGSATHTRYSCTPNVLPRSAFWCEPCVSDAQCEPGQACFAAHGHGECLELKTPEQQYSYYIDYPNLVRVTSVSGLGALSPTDAPGASGVDVFQLSGATCALVLKAGDAGGLGGSCVRDSDCGEPDVDDGICGDSNTCTIPCEVAEDCGTYYPGLVVFGSCIQELCVWSFG